MSRREVKEKEGLNPSRMLQLARRTSAQAPGSVVVGGARGLVLGFIFAAIATYRLRSKRRPADRGILEIVECERIRVAGRVDRDCYYRLFCHVQE